MAAMGRRAGGRFAAGNPDLGISVLAILHVEFCMQNDCGLNVKTADSVGH
jgi:hypothetical protein